jgi:hypothetical protein
MLALGFALLFPLAGPPCFPVAALLSGFPLLPLVLVLLGFALSLSFFNLPWETLGSFGSFSI